MPADERRRYALTGPPPPDWFTGMQPAPWIDGNVISEGRKLAGVSLVDVPPVGVPPGQHIYVPAQTRRHVPPDVPVPDSPARPLVLPGVGRRAGRHRASPAHGEQPLTSSGATGRHSNAAPGGGQVAVSAEEMIIGIAAAARYLGYRKPDSFRRARTRRPIPGEGKTDDGRPCWTPHALRSWQSKRKIAGNRADGREPD
jgi:hypothetical protein